MGAKTAILAIRIISDASKAAAGLDQVEQKTGKWAGRAEKAGKIAGGILATGVGAAALALKNGTQSAIEDQAAQAKLAQTLQKTAGASASQVKATEDWITKTALATGVADDELRPALSKLAAATGSVEKAQRLTALSMDVAAARGVSLEQVTKAVEKAQNGQVSGLSRLGIETKNAAGETISAEEAMRRLSDTYGGAAATAADTLAGKQARLKVAWDEAWETLGAMLIPALTVLADKMAKGMEWATKHGKAVGILAGVFAGLLATVYLVSAATKAWNAIQTIARVATTTWTVAQKALNLALRANPIGLVVTAVGLLIAGLVLAYRKSETFRNIVQAVGRAGQAAMGWVVDRVQDVARWIGNVPEVLGRFGDAVGRVRQRAVDGFNAMLAPIRAVGDWVQWLLDKIASIRIPSLGGIAKAVGGVFGFASAATSPTLAGATALAAPTLTGASTLTGPSGSAMGRGFGDAAVVVQINGALDPVAVARQVEQLLGRQARRIGGSA